MRRALVACLLVAACAKPRPPSPTAAALARLHGALASGDLAAATGTVPLARAELLAQMARMHDIQAEHGDSRGATELGWRTMLADLDAHAQGASLAREFAAARALLGDGRCAELRAVALPEALAHVATPRPTWPAFVAAEVRAPLVALVAQAKAGEYRCEGSGRVFRAVFVPGGDGELVVARVEAAGP
jgi:hypothetical protein